MDLQKHKDLAPETRGHDERLLIRTYRAVSVALRSKRQVVEQGTSVPRAVTGDHIIASRAASAKWVGSHNGHSEALLTVFPTAHGSGDSPGDSGSEGLLDHPHRSTLGIEQVARGSLGASRSARPRAEGAARSLRKTFTDRGVCAILFACPCARPRRAPRACIGGALDRNVRPKQGGASGEGEGVEEGQAKY